MKKIILSLVAFFIMFHSNVADAKSLVVYFSHTGNTQKLAETIHQQTDSDIVRIEPIVPYSQDHQQVVAYALKERQNDARPLFRELAISLKDYDTIYVGFPLWWYTMPMVMFTFFDKYDFSGKTIAPFVTHGGSFEGNSFEDVKKLEPNAKVLDGLVVSDEEIKDDQIETVRTWIEKQ